MPTHKKKTHARKRVHTHAQLSFFLSRSHSPPFHKLDACECVFFAHSLPLPECIHACMLINRTPPPGGGAFLSPEGCHRYLTHRFYIEKDLDPVSDPRKLQQLVAGIFRYTHHIRAMPASWAKLSTRAMSWTHSAHSSCQ